MTLTAVMSIMLPWLAACQTTGDKTDPTTDTKQSTDTTPATKPNGTDVPDDSAIKVDTDMKGNKYKNVIYNKDGIKIDFGVLSDTNMFAPGEDINFWFQITGKALDGKDAKIQFSSVELRVSKEISFKLKQPDNEKHSYTGSFSAELNGVYTLTLVLPGDLRVSFKVGVVPKNTIANDNFYFGVQPYICRAYTWGSGFMVDGQTFDVSEASILNTIEWLGCNIIREDGTVWGTMQPTETSPINYKWMDRIAEKTAERGMILNWLLQSSPMWAVKQEYLSLTDESFYWSVCPQEDKWDAYATALAERYAKNDNIIWEIWNEPDWEFFTGTPQDYIDLLERTAKIFRKANPNIHLYPGGLTVVNDPKDYRYKDSRPMFEGFKRLLDEKLIDTFSIHIHGPFNDFYFYKTLEEMTKQAEAAGLSMSGIYNTEAGLYENNQDKQAENLMAKILYTRGHDYKMYVQYSFRAFPSAPDDGWAIFDSYLQPKKAAIAYAVLIGKLGQSEKIGTISDKRSMYADLYYDGKQSIVTVFNDGQLGDKLVLPAGVSVKAYNIYGNPIEVNGTVTATLSPVYLVFDGKLATSAFSVK